MNKQKIYELINPLRTTTWRNSKHFPEINEENYRLYYELSCRVYNRCNDERYQRIDSIRNIIWSETPEFQGRQYWTGTKKAITYRTNRIEQNLEYFLRRCELKGVVQRLWEVYNWKDYQVLGYIKAHSKDEAEQLSKMMFDPVVKAVKGTMGLREKMPLWSFEVEESKRIYVNLCLKADKEIEEIIKSKKEYIYSLEKEIENCYLIKDFINLNMSTFEG